MVYESLFTQPVRQVIKKMLAAIKPNHMYHISIINKKAGHEMTIRQIPTGGYEYYDSNIGIVFIPEKSHLEKWLVLALSAVWRLCSRNAHSVLWLYHPWAQPDNARSSVPPIIAEDPVLQPTPVVVKDITQKRIDYTSQIWAQTTLEKKEEKLLNWHFALLNEMNELISSIVTFRRRFQ